MGVASAVAGSVAQAAATAKGSGQQSMRERWQGAAAGSRGVVAVVVEAAAAFVRGRDS